ncbi:splicing factor 3B subunit 1 [Rhipicephalus sanguineus]|uniref:splicing factor 3B subunit 1 n=1 Tax=Rhipicephalus sanguineus TaxID=34632 RepID=UPI00189313A2|nr:splicing factor 3B subunit 1 [Rhipicephalus sanguineus]
MAAPPVSAEDIEAQIREIQARKAGVGKQGNFDNGEGVPLTASANGAYMDEDIYGHTQSKYDGYVTSIAANDDADADDDDYESTGLMQTKKMPLPSAFLAELTDKDYDPFADRRVPRIADREDQYRAQRRKLMISPERVDPFADGGKTPDMKSRTYTVIMQEQALTKDQAELRRKLADKAKAGELQSVPSNGEVKQAAPAVKRRRWDQAGDETPQTPAKKKSSWDAAESSQTPSHARWDETPGRAKGSETPGATPGYSSTRMWDPTPAHATPGHATPGHETPGGTQKGAAPGTPSARRNRWDETPKTERETPGHGSGWAETPRTDRTGGADLIQDTPTPSASKRRSRWDETPSSQMGNQTPQTPSAMTPSSTMTPSGVTPTGAKAMAMATPTPGHIMAMTPEQLQVSEPPNCS